MAIIIIKMAQMVVSVQLIFKKMGLCQYLESTSSLAYWRVNGLPMINEKTTIPASAELINLTAAIADKGINSWRPLINKKANRRMDPQGRMNPFLSSLK